MSPISKPDILLEQTMDPIFVIRISFGNAKTPFKIKLKKRL